MPATSAPPPRYATPTTPATTLVITSTIRQIQHHRCIRWTGDQVEAGVPTSTHYLGEGLKAWLPDLKAAAEARPCD
ncbi:hypothetical protein FHS29_005189 [Saccharothrix tamanrassetensis]|uniref:Uncharacterized protein n=1 Tax=Saccharothrix tamanrassetensis TaxID=1051531 RepID=A0A841CLY5_9PSEU|nr:hypothetical protein [Saccharothrix tamanrassetensis]